MSFLGWFQRQRSLTRIALVLSGAIGIVLFSFALLMTYIAWNWDKGMCGSHGSHEFISPDGRSKAVLFEFDCGATTDFGTQIALLPAAKSFSAGNVTDDQRIFSADSDHQVIGVDREGILPVKVQWLSPQKLRIEFPAKARIFQSSYKNGMVEIEYASR